MYPRSTPRRDGSDIAEIIHGGGVYPRRNSPQIAPQTPSIRQDFHKSRPNTPASASQQRACRSGAIPKTTKVSTPFVKRTIESQVSTVRRNQDRRPAGGTLIPGFKYHPPKKFYESPLKHFVHRDKLTYKRAREWLAYLPTLQKYYRKRIQEFPNSRPEHYENEQRAKESQSEMDFNEPTYSMDDRGRKNATGCYRKPHHVDEAPSEESLITPESAKIPFQNPRKPIRQRVKRVHHDASTPRRMRSDIETCAARKHAQAHLFHTIRKKWAKPNLGDYKINFPEDDDVESLSIDEEMENELKDESDKWFPKGSPTPSWAQKRWLEKIRTTRLPNLTWNCTRTYNPDYPQWANREVLETVDENSSQIDDDGEDYDPRCEIGSDDGSSSYSPN